MKIRIRKQFPKFQNRTGFTGNEYKKGACSFWRVT